MGYILRQGLSFCFAGGRHLFLDLRNDRYFCLPEKAETTFAKIVARQGPSREDVQGLEMLLASGILHRTASDVCPQTCNPAGTSSSSLQQNVKDHTFLGHLPAALLYLATAVVRLRAHGLSGVIGHIERTKIKRGKTSVGSSIEAVAKVAAAFRRSGMLVSSHDQCLRHSIAMEIYLVHLGVQADLVFGVMARPFRAHCWVQHEGVVLNDELEHVHNFTPILII